ncbi:amidophosphoribosyltransferase, partial [Planctomycetota bacterium]|nr:amidophosphoribosyltransferase [Planctomycetota bacterium]
AQPGGSSDPAERIADACAQLKGAFSLLVMTPTFIAGVRDPGGMRPLWLGQAESGAYGFSSETPAFDLTRIKALNEVEPGTVVVASDEPLRVIRYAEPKLAHCIFEHVYFARPDSRLFGDTVLKVRKELGAALAREHPVEADVVISIPDSGNAAAMGYSQESGIPFEQGFIRNHYVGRTFIEPTQAKRVLTTDLKLNVVPWAVEGKRVIVVDDSVVRGTTATRRCRYLREAGATEIHLRVACPPLRHPCFYGIDFQSKGELIAAKHTLEEVAKIMELDSLGYLSVQGMLDSVSGDDDNYCTACWTGDYPIPIPEGLSKQSCLGEIIPEDFPPGGHETTRDEERT